jgi:AraC family transcriptional regulator
MEDLVIVLQTGGSPKIPIEVDRNTKLNPSRPGLLTIIPPHTKITWHTDGFVHSYSLHLSQNCFSGFGSSVSKDLGELFRLRCAIQDTLLSNLVQALASELGEPTESGQLYAETMAACIAVHVGRDAIGVRNAKRSAGLSKETLRRLLDFIESRLDVGTSLQELAAEACLCRAHFAACFRNSTGMSPHKYVMERRIAAAKTMLEGAALPLSEVALACGFSSQTHFTDCFKRTTGLTPAQYRSVGSNPHKPVRVAAEESRRSQPRGAYVIAQ